MIFFTDDLNNLWTKAIKSSLIKLDDYSDYLEMNNGEDNMFLIPLLIRAKKIVNINDYFYNYRDNSKGITSTFKKSKIDDEFMRYNYTLEHLKNLNINDFENLKKLEIFFFKKIIILILQAMCSNNSFKEKLNIINNVRCSNEIENIFQKLNINHFKNSSKNLYYFYKFKLYGFIFAYSNLYSLINKAKQKRYIRQYSESKILED